MPYTYIINLLSTINLKENKSVSTFEDIFIIQKCFPTQPISVVANSVFFMCILFHCDIKIIISVS